MRIREAEPGEEAPNLMPLIDVVFLLLIFFLVATQVAQEEINREVQLASSATAEPISAPPRQMFINILADGTIAVGNETYDLQTIRPVIDRVARNAPGRDIVIRGDKRVAFEVPSRVLDLARDAGMNEANITLLRYDPAEAASP